MDDLKRNRLDPSKNIFVSKLKDFSVRSKLEPVQNNPSFRYIGALMNEQKYLNFKGYVTMAEVKDDVRHYENFVQWINQNDRYLYFDIDDVLLNEIEFKSYISEFIDCLNTHLSDDNVVRVSLDDFQYHTKLSKCGRIKSIHIISNKYFMDYEQMDALVDKMIMTIKNIDPCLYGKGRALFNCFNGKCGNRAFYYHEINTRPYELIWIDAPQLSDSSERVVYKQEIELKTELHVNNFINYLIENKEKYLTNTQSWLMTCAYVKRYNIMTATVFCTNSLVKPFTFEDNMKIWDELHDRNAVNSEAYLCQKICKQKLRCDPYDDDFLGNIGLDEETIMATRLSVAETISFKHCCDGTDRTFNTRTGILRVGDDAWMPMADKKMDCVKTNYEEITVDELSNHYNDKRVFLRALYGVGKTHHFIRPVVKLVQERGGSILFITENNVLNSQFSSKFNLTSHTSKDYTDDYQVVTSLESFIKFKRTEYDLVVLDEFVSLMAQFNSTTMHKVNHHDVMRKLRKVFRDAEQIIVADADLSDNTYTSILNEIQPSHERTILSVKTDNYKDYRYEFVFDEPLFNSRLDADICNNLRVSIAVTIRSMAESIYTRYKDHKNIIFVSRDATIINNRILNEKEVTEFKCGALDRYFKENAIDLFIYSPTITTGLSIDTLYFDRQYGYAKALERAPPPRTLLQMLHRTRKIRNKTIVICTPKPRITTTDYDIRYMERDSALTAQRMKLNGYEYAVNNILADIENETEAEKLYGVKNFTEALYILLKRHKLVVSLGQEIELSDKSEDLMFGTGNSVDRLTNYIFTHTVYLDVYEDARDVAERSLNKRYFDSNKFQVYSLFIDMKYEDIPVKRQYRDKDDVLRERTEYKSYTFNGVFRPHYFIGLLSDVISHSPTYRPLTTCGAFLPELVKRIIHVKQIKIGWRSYGTRIERKQNYQKNINNNSDAKRWMNETIKIDIREWMDSLAVDGRITQLNKKFKVPADLLENINSLRTSAKQKPLKIDDKFTTFNFIKKIMEDTYGYSYERIGRNGTEAVLVKLPYVRFGKRKFTPLNERMGVELAPQQVRICDEGSHEWSDGSGYELIERKNKLIAVPVSRQIYPKEYIQYKPETLRTKSSTIYGFKLSNKYGLRNQHRLRELYDNMRLLCTKREYIINPSKAVTALIGRVDALIDTRKPPSQWHVMFGMKFPVDTLCLTE